MCSVSEHFVFNNTSLFNCKNVASKKTEIPHRFDWKRRKLFLQRFVMTNYSYRRFIAFYSVYTYIYVCITFYIVSTKYDLDANALKDLNVFQKSRTAEERAIFQKILQDDFQCPTSSAKKETNWTYATCVFEILLQISKELECYDEIPITINETKKMHIGIRKAIEYGLRPFLLNVSTSIELPYIIACTKVLLNIASGKFFPLISTRNDQHLIYTDLLSSIFTILCHAGDEVKSDFEEHLLCIQSKLSHTDYFKVLFLIKGSKSNQSDSPVQQMVHKQLMESLYRPGSFKALCEALLPSITSLDQDEKIVKKRMHSCTVISTIVAKRGHSRNFYHRMIDEICKHLISFIQSNKSHQLYFVDVGVGCLSKLSTLQLKFIQNQILDFLFGTFIKLATPPDLIAGAIVCESNEFLEAVHLVHLTFCAMGPSDDTISSKFLTPFMPLFIQLHQMLINSTNKALKNEILAVIVRCLSNQKTSEIEKIIESVLFEEYGENLKYLHPRLKNPMLNGHNKDNESYVFSVAATLRVSNSIVDGFDINAFLQSSISLINVLKQCDNNVLIYNVFLHLFQIFSDNFAASKLLESSSCSSELFTSEDELKRGIEIKFKRKYAIVYALNELILFKPFHGQFAENPHDIVAVLDKIIHRQMEHIELAQRSKQVLLAENFDEILIVVLSCIAELMSYVKGDDLKIQLRKTLQKLNTQLQSDKIKESAESKIILKKLDMLLDNRLNSNENSKFHAYKAILSETSSEPYTKVYGIMNLIKLIKVKDEDTCTNAHILLVLAIKLLKEEDSYIFLNCIKLLIGLFEVLEGTVLETLISEYHFNIDDDAVNIDFKLKVGETIIKVTEGLGEISYKYKDILINCFLRGVNNQNNEFRTSNMSNLGVIMRILSYQVHHFVQEVSVQLMA